MLVWWLLQTESSADTLDENSNLERQERVSRMTEIEDLQAPHSLPYAPLCIKVSIACVNKWNLVMAGNNLSCIRIHGSILILNKSMRLKL